MAAGLVQLGESKIVVCGGQESMSQAPHFINHRAGHKLGDAKFIDTILNDALIDPFYNYHMGITGT